jgi:hypothetical protein
VHKRALDFYKDNNTKFWWVEDGEMLVRVILGDIIFYLHVIDRFAFDILGEEQRTIFKDALLPVVRDILVHPLETADEKIRLAEDFQVAYKKAHMTYSPYAMIPEQSGRPPK